MIKQSNTKNKTLINTKSLSKIKNNVKKLLTSLNKKAGRNNSGKVTVYHKGGGNKKIYKKINFKDMPETAIVTNIEYDSNRTAYIAKSFCLENSQYYYILAPKNLKILDIIKTNSKELNLNQEGNRYPLYTFNIGDIVHNIEIELKSGGVFARSAGTGAQIISKGANHVTINLPSGEHRLISKYCKASLGYVSNENHKNTIIGKAGKSRSLNKRPTVRGVAMNPIDHPHGGGEGKTSGGRPSVTPWGKYTKGQPTRSKKKNNKFIIKSRKIKK